MLTTEQIELLKTTIAKGLSDLELQLFLNVCDRTGLDPFARQICPVLRWDKKANGNVMSIQVQVDGYRQIAQNSGEYAGCDRALFDEGLTLYEHLQTGRGKPKTCTITVYRLIKGVRCPFTADISWDDFYPGDKLGFMWISKPHQMVSKTCESQALRKAFQGELKHLVVEEEIAIDTVEPTTRQVRQSDEWMNMQSELRVAKTADEVTAIAAATQSRLPMDGNQYRLEKEMTIANDRLEMSAPISVAMPEPSTPPKKTNVFGVQIKKVCTILGIKASEAYRQATPVLGIDKPSESLVKAEFVAVTNEILAQWGMSQGCFRAIVHSRNALVKMTLDNPDPGGDMEAIAVAWKVECDRRKQEKGKPQPVESWA